LRFSLDYRSFHLYNHDTRKEARQVTLNSVVFKTPLPLKRQVTLNSAVFKTPLPLKRQVTLKTALFSKHL